MLLNLEPDHIDRHDDVRGVPRRQAAHLRAPGPRTTSPSCRAASAAFPGAARRVEFSGADPLPGRAAHPGCAQPRERRRGDCRGARRRYRRRGDRARRLRALRGRRAPDRADRGGRRRPLRQRLEGDERRRGAAGARVVPGAPLHVILGGLGKHESYAPLAAALGAGRPRLPDRGGGAGDRRRARRRRRAVRAMPGTSRQRWPEPQKRQRAAMSCCSLRRVRASTSSRATRSVGRSSGGWSQKLHE